MKEWGFAQTDTSQQMAELHLYSITKAQPGGDVKIQIGVMHTVYAP